MARGYGVRILCSVIAFLSVMMSVFIWFSTYSEEKATEKYRKGIEYNTAKISDAEEEKEAAEKEKEILLAEKTELESKIASAKKLAYYETNPVCFLTFDNGSSANTQKLLDILKAYGVKGTFFTVGSMLDSTSGQEAILKIVSDGHTLGMRTNGSDNSVIFKSKDSYLDDIMTLRSRLEELTGITSSVVRMPGGTVSAYSYFEKYAGDAEIYYKVLDELEYQGIAVCDWNVETKDYSSSTGVSKIIEYAEEGASKRLEGNYKYRSVVLLLHDTSSTVSALPGIIEKLSDMGFSFEALSPDGYIYRQK